MNIIEGLQGITHLFLDTAPVIYLVEQNPQYLELVRMVFQGINQGWLNAVTSPVTLAECLVNPYSLEQTKLQQDFIELVTNTNHIEFVEINEAIALHSAQLRARYNLSLTDALQIGVALFANCEAFLTNDIMLKRVTELQILVLDEFVVSGQTS